MIKPSDYNLLPTLAAKAAPSWKSLFKKHKKRLESMDNLVHQFHDTYSARIDCLACARCCKTLGPRIESKDVERIAKALRRKPVDVINQYLRIDEDGDLVFASMPCPFLGADHYCSIYESRPKACREYPHTDRKRFYQITTLSIKNAETCPIVYEVLQDLSKLL
ncbi:MAG: YkgJ family cysteine cluster protein, partial [Bacteroidales bacterium]|nr:YkgJ family cysteine cluster protein [Bacteroidales bacterium]